MKKKFVSLVVVWAMLLTCCTALCSAISVSAADALTAEYLPTGARVYDMKSVWNASEQSGKTLAWNNPSADTLESVSVVDISDGTEQVLATASDRKELVSNEVPEMDATPSRGQIYKPEGEFTVVKLKFEFSDHTPTEFYLSSDLIADPANSGDKIQDWHVVTHFNRTGPTQWTFANGMQDTAVSYSGNASLRLDMQQPMQLQNCYYRIMAPNLVTTAGTEYKLTLQYKKENMGHVRAVWMKGDTVLTNDVATQIGGTTEETTDWTSYEYTFTPTAGNEVNRIGIQVFGGSGSIWIDDVVLCEVGQEGTNLLANGDFERGVDMNAPAEPAEVFAVEGEDGTITLGWQASTDLNAAEIRLYQGEGLIGSFANTALELPLIGADWNTSYTLKAVNKNNVESDSAPFTLEDVKAEEPPPPPPIEAEEYLPSLARTYNVRGGVIFGWVNPKAATLSKVSVYDASSVTEKLLADSDTNSDAFDVTPQHAQNYLVPVGSVPKMVKLKFEFSDGAAPVEFYLSGTAIEDPAQNGKVPGWTAEQYHASEAETNGMWSTAYGMLDAAEKDNGSTALRLSAVMPHEGSNLYFYRFTSNPITLQKEKSYRVTFRYKADNMGWFRLAVPLNEMAKGASIVSNINQPCASTDGWQSYDSDVFSPKADATADQLSGNLCLSAYFGSGSVWVDDIVLCEVEDGVDGANMLTNGEFETSAANLAAPGEVGTVYALEDGSATTLTWAASADPNAAEVRLYRGDVLIGSFANTGITVPLLNADKSAAYTIKTVNAYNVESEGNSFTLEDVILDAPPEEPEAPAEAPGAEYLPTIPRTYNLSGNTTYAWVNPSSYTLTKVSIYDVSGDEPVLVTDSEANPEGGLTIMPATPQAYTTATPPRIVRLEFEFSDREPTVFYLSGSVTDSLVSNPIPGWTLHHGHGQISSANGGWMYAYGMQDVNEHASGNASLRMTTQVPTQFTNSVYRLLTPNLNLPKDTTYEITLKYKTENMGWVRLAVPPGEVNGLGHTIGSGSNTNFVTTDGWQDFSAQFTTKGDILDSFSLSIYTGAGTVWLDDVVMREVKADGTYGENLLPNSGFEEGASLSRPEEVKNASGEAYNKEGTIRWNRSGGTNVSEVRLYEVINDVPFQIGSFANDDQAVPVSGLVNKTENKFIIKTVSPYGVESAGTEVTVIPGAPDTYFSEIVKNPDGTVQVTVDNNGVAEGFASEFILAFYEGGRMVGAKSAQHAVQLNESHTYSLKMESSWRRGTLYAFLWDSVEGMEILKDSAAFEIAE